MNKFVYEVNYYYYTYTVSQQGCIKVGRCGTRGNAFQQRRLPLKKNSFIGMVREGMYFGLSKFDLPTPPRKLSNSYNSFSVETVPILFWSANLDQQVFII